MSTIFSLRRSADEDDRTSGGKIVRSRRTRAAERTPYARPIPLPAAEEVESSGNPNWLSGLIQPARAIASGAGRILSSVFGPDSFSSSSDDDYVPEDEDDASNAANVDLNKALSSMNTKSENMHLIQQLVMEQTFSREECEELIKLIESRVVKGDGNLSNPEMTDGCNNAVMEARKWLKEKKSRSSSKLKVTHGEIGSPVDMAKSYMQAQPTWSSPALKHVEFRTPSPMQNSKEIFHSPVQLSEMKGSALSTGSWNILDEIRRVRSKATEELLVTTPSKKISLASTSREDKSMQDAMENNVNDEALQIDNASLVPKQCQDGKTIETIGDLDAANGTNPDVSSNQLDGCHLSHEMNGSRDPATTDHALSLSAAVQTLEPCRKETIGAVDSSKEKVDGSVADNLQLQNEHSNHALHETNDKDRVLSGLQDSSSMLYEDSLQDATHSTPNRKGKDATLGRNLRPRNKRGKR